MPNIPNLEELGTQTVPNTSNIYSQPGYSSAQNIPGPNLNICHNRTGYTNTNFIAPNMSPDNQMVPNILPEPQNFDGESSNSSQNIYTYNILQEMEPNIGAPDLSQNLYLNNIEYQPNIGEFSPNFTQNSRRLSENFQNENTEELQMYASDPNLGNYYKNLSPASVSSSSASNLSGSDDNLNYNTDLGLNTGLTVFQEVLVTQNERESEFEILSQMFKDLEEEHLQQLDDAVEIMKKAAEERREIRNSVSTEYSDQMSPLSITTNSSSSPTHSEDSNGWIPCDINR